MYILTVCMAPMFGNDAQKVTAAWDVCVRQSYSLPFATHLYRYIVQDINESPQSPGKSSYTQFIVEACF